MPGSRPKTTPGRDAGACAHVGEAVDGERLPEQVGVVRRRHTGQGAYGPQRRRALVGVVTGVWGEMLTYAASKCRGSTHMRKLNRGGELITLVWLLIQHMGMSDMYEIQEGDPSVKLIVQY
ncbi:unnamed protein product [Urochloa humidicola]